MAGRVGECTRETEEPRRQKAVPAQRAAVGSPPVKSGGAWRRAPRSAALTRWHFLREKTGLDMLFGVRETFMTRRV